MYSRLILIFVSCATILAKPDVPLSPSNVQVNCSNMTARVEFGYDYPSDSQRWPYEFYLQYNDDPEEPAAWNTHPVPIKILENDRGVIILPLHPYATFKFRIIARNSFGDSTPAYSDDESCTTPPSEPTSNPVLVHTKSVNVSQNSLFIHWQGLPRNEWHGPGFYYLVEYRPLDGSQELRTVTVSNASNSVIIPNQPTYRPYQIRVWAGNAIGLSSKKPVTVVGYSGEGKPASSPSGFGLTKKNTLRGNVATFTWKPVHEWSIHGKLKNYKITHWSEDESVKKESYYGPDATTGTVNALTANRTNYATISIENDSGHEGPSSNVISFSMQNGPPSKVNCLSATIHPSGVVTVFWRPPDYFNDAPIGYAIQWCSRKANQADTDWKTRAVKDDSTCVAGPTLTSNDTEYSIIDIEPMSDYTIKVAAISASGTGHACKLEVSIASVAVLNGPTPMRPELRSIRAFHHESRIAWAFATKDYEKAESAENKLVNVTAYVKYKKRNSELFRFVPVTTGHRRVVLTGLCPGTFYEVVVVHFIEYFPGKWSRLEFDADFSTAEPKDVSCTEESLRFPPGTTDLV